MKIKSKNELIVKAFVQTVSSATSFTKRYKKVCKLLDSRHQFTEEQWLYIWRGMYYTIWYTEMSKGCDQLAQKIGTFDDLTMILTGFKALTNDWFGIDAFRIDKYMFLVRIMANNCLKLQSNYLLNDKTINNELNDKQTNEIEDNVDKEVNTSDNQNESKSNDSENKKSNKKFNKRKAIQKKEIVFPIEIKAQIVDNVLTTVKTSIGLTLHISDIFIDELVKVIDELKHKLNVEKKFELYFDILLPFVKLMALTEDYRILTSITQNIFDRFKNEILISESIDTRKLVLQKFIEGMIAIGSVEDIGRKNRDSIYNIIGVYKSKLNKLNENNNKKSLKRRKIVTKSGKHKKVKYEVTSGSPFVRSFVPIAVI